MKRIVTFLSTVLLVLNLCSGVFAEEIVQEGNTDITASSEQSEPLTEEAQEPECEWNVLIYLCGTDLESTFGAATSNLRAIAETVPDKSVNLIVETGGTRNWKCKEELGIDVANDRLQRWYYGEDGFVLVDETEEACMSDDRTLSDFIRWGAENYSAKKNMLILWDHGGGSNRGLLRDENYGGTLMPVYVLENALREGGTHFDLLLTDTCLMATLEMSQAVAPYADYLVASEEVLAGDGTNYKGWVQYLYDRPDCSAVQLGKRVCDSTQQYYSEKDAKSAVSTFTMSLIDLSRIGAVAEAYNAYMHDVSELVQDPKAFAAYARATYYAENYYLDTMYDLFDLTRRAENGGISKKVTHAVQDAVEDAVLYNLRSENHMYSHGLSVFYSLNENGDSLDHFARTCKNPEQLAFLDCVTIDWDAPDWVYEDNARYPELNRNAYFVVPEVSYSEDKSKAYLTLKSGNESAAYLSYALYYTDNDTGIAYTLGESGNLIPEETEDGTCRYALGFDGTWPALAGKPLCMSIADETESYILYNSPAIVQFGRMQMRIMVNYDKDAGEEGNEDTSEAVQEEASEDAAEDTAEDIIEEEPEVHNETKGSPYELLGFWDGYDAHTGLPGRNVLPVSNLEGEPVTLCDAVYSTMYEKITEYLDSTETVLTDDTVIEREKLPTGEYWIRFVVRDILNHTTYSQYFKVGWDGESVSFLSEDE